MKLTISLHLEDISTLEYIHSVLKLGNLNTYKDLKSPTCKLIINRTELQEILFPLLIYNNIFFLTETRNDQFNLAMHILKNEIKMYDDIPSKDNIKNVFKLPESAYDYTLLHFFKNWIVGFTCPCSYAGVVKFAQENPLTYKRVKKEYKKLCSNRKSYYYLLEYLRDKEKKQKESLRAASLHKQQKQYEKKRQQLNNVRNYSTYVVKPKDTDIVIWGSNLSSTAGRGRFTKIV